MALKVDRFPVDMEGAPFTAASLRPQRHEDRTGRSDQLMRSVRTYLAGLGSGGAMLAAVAAGFLTLGTLVSFEGLPGSSSRSDEGVVIAQSKAPEIAAVAAAAPGAAPAAGPGFSTLAAAERRRRAGRRRLRTSPQALVQVPIPRPIPIRPVPIPRPIPIRPVLILRRPRPATWPALWRRSTTPSPGATGIDLGLPDKTKPITDILDNTVGGVTGGRGLGLKPDLPDLPKLTPSGSGALP